MRSSGFNRISQDKSHLTTATKIVRVNANSASVLQQTNKLHKRIALTAVKDVPGPYPKWPRLESRTAQGFLLALCSIPLVISFFFFFSFVREVGVSA